MFQALLGKAAPGLATNDPYSLVPTIANVTGGATCNNFPDWANPNGKVAVDVSTLTSPIVGILVGQSLATNCVNGTYAPTGGTAYNFSITNGGTYQASDPLMGCTGWHNLPSNPWPTGSWFTRLPDKIKARSITRPVILVPIGVGGSNVYDWQSPTLGTGGGNFARFAVTAKRLTVAGLTPSFVYWQQGESNNGNTTQAQYTTALNSVISGIRAQWATVPILIAISTYINGSADANVAAAQAAAVNNPSGIYAGANGDSLTGTNRQSDNTHWSTTGADAYAGLADTALHNAGIY
jgi:hypothetical protein